MPEALIPIVLFVMMGAVGMSFSPIGRAIARRVGGDKGEHESAAPAEVEALHEEVQALRAELSEMHERVDFTERLLAQAKAKGLLGTGGQ